jgi:hypothetical protein
MRSQLLKYLLAFILSWGASVESPRADPVSPDRGFTEKLCIPHENWPHLERVMKAFGAEHDMQFHGEIEPLSTAVPSAHLNNQLNFALIKGLHQFGGDDFDLWLVSNPSTYNEVHLNVLTRRPITPDQMGIAKRFREVLQTIACEQSQIPD